MPSSQPTVLVVDDEPDLADLYATWLASEYEVRTAYSGDSALDKLDDTIDYVLLDRRMPGISGDRVLDTIRERDINCRVAMVTAVEPDFDIIEMGFDDYVVKPVTSEDLFSLLERLTSVKSYDDVGQQYYQLAAKRAALESSKSETTLAESGEYNRLVNELEEVKKLADDRLGEVGDNAFSQL